MLGEAPLFLNGNHLSPSYDVVLPLDPQTRKEQFLAQLDHYLAGFEIAGDFLLEDLDGGTLAYRVRTLNEGEWEILVDPNVYSHQADDIKPYDYNTVLAALAPRQDLRTLLDISISSHQRPGYLLRKNWPLFVSLLSFGDTGSIDFGQAALGEVNLGSPYGQPDFIGISPRHIFLIEILYGEGFAQLVDKSMKIKQYAEGLQKRYDCPKDAIVPLLASYKLDYNYIHLQPPLTELTNGHHRTEEVFSQARHFAR